MLTSTLLLFIFIDVNGNHQLCAFDCMYVEFIEWYHFIDKKNKKEKKWETNRSICVGGRNVLVSSSSYIHTQCFFIKRSHHFNWLRIEEFVLNWTFFPVTRIQVAFAPHLFYFILFLYTQIISYTSWKCNVQIPLIVARATIGYSIIAQHCL